MENITQQKSRNLSPPSPGTAAQQMFPGMGTALVPASIKNNAQPRGTICWAAFPGQGSEKLWLAPGLTAEN